MQQTIVEQQKQYFYNSSLPLAIYREISAHLRQIPGVRTGLVEQDAERFDYQQSQLKGLWIESPTDLSPVEERNLQAILDYYGQKYGVWQN